MKRTFVWAAVGAGMTGFVIFARFASPMLNFGGALMAIDMAFTFMAIGYLNGSRHEEELVKP